MSEHYERWTVRSYDVLSITLTSDYVAVWAFDCPSDPGRHALEVHPIDGLAAVRVTERELERPKGEKCLGQEVARHVYNELLGVELVEGRFSVVDESSNFIGLIRAGDDPRSLATGDSAWRDGREFPLATGNLA